MNHKHETHSSSLFLLELVIAIVIFALCSAVSLQFFAKAHLWNKEAKALHFFSNECSMAAEICGISSSLEDFEKHLQNLYPDTPIKNGSLLLSYDDLLKPCSSCDERFLYSLTFSQQEEMLYVTMEVTDTNNSSIFFNLESIHHIGGASYAP